MADTTSADLGAVYVKVNSSGDYELRDTPLSLNYPAASDVRMATSFGHGEAVHAGTLAVPSAARVLSGAAVDATVGTLALPSAAKVLAGTAYGEGGAGSTGTYAPDFTDAANVLDTDTVNGSAGTFSEASRNTDPGAANVLSGVAYKIRNADYTGTLATISDSEGSGIYPSANDVLSRAGQYGPTGTEYAGDAVLPGVGDVRLGVGYGANSTELTGTMLADSDTVPTTPAVVFADIGNGTGAVASISGSESASSNSILAVAAGGGSWSNLGSRVGDGAITLALAQGVYWGCCISNTGGGAAQSAVAGFSVTSGDGGPSEIRTYLRGLLLADAGLVALLANSTAIHWRKQPAQASYPCIVYETSEELDTGFDAAGALDMAVNFDCWATSATAAEALAARISLVLEGACFTSDNWAVRMISKTGSSALASTDRTSTGLAIEGRREIYALRAFKRGA